MWFYLLGLGLVSDAAVHQLHRVNPGAFGRTRANAILGFVAGVAAAVCFVAGFFRFSWWVPPVGMWLSPLIWGHLWNLAAAKQHPITYMRVPIGILVGTGAALVGLIMGR